ncbi:hypothetical protein [Isoptericola sp. NPDC056605]|uniref:hypothetical protein n=1 Tax=Isoptericola sp. NPDC056605 TaxID=3345876 RepID=UPI0036CB5948
MARIVRPLHGRVRVWLPFRGGGGNYQLLKDMCGLRTRPDYNRDLKCFEVAREHLPVLLDELPGALGQPVSVALHGSAQTKCVEVCWNASPDTLWKCECSCAGRYHGSRTGPPKQVAPGLGVDTEYTKHEFTLFP